MSCLRSDRALRLGLVLVVASAATDARGYDERIPELEKQLALTDQAHQDCRDFLERVAKILQNRGRISSSSGPRLEDVLQKVIDDSEEAQGKAHIAAQENAELRRTITAMDADIASMREAAQELRRNLARGEENRAAWEREKQQIQADMRAIESTGRELQARLKDAEESVTTVKQAKAQAEEISRQKVHTERVVEELQGKLRLSEQENLRLRKALEALQEENQRLRDALDRLEAEVALWKAKAAEYQSRIVVYAPVAAELNNIERPYVPIGFRPPLHGREVHVLVLVGADGKGHVQEIEKRNGVADWVIARIEECVRRSHWRPARDESNRQVDQIRRVIFRFLW